MPENNLHMTAMEVTHSKTAPEIEELVKSIQPRASMLTDYLIEHRARLIQPMISYDTSALALSFVPAAGEGLGPNRTREDDSYTYHQLRRDLYVLCEETGVPVASRYCVPSAHLTIARFISQDGFEEDGNFDHTKAQALVAKIDELNQWLKSEYWPAETGPIRPGGEWIVGEEKGLDFRKGQLWYGGGETIRLGKGF